MEIMRNLENRMLDKRIEGMQPLGVISRVGREATPSPSSNRTCGFPASGFPEDSCLRHAQG
jgi:hypothetical protein